MEIIHAKLITYREELGGYIMYVFQNLDTNLYEMCTRLPNWETPVLQIGDEGFLKFDEVIAGKDTWYDSNLDSFVPYRYTKVYFIDFVYEKPTESDLVL